MEPVLLFSRSMVRLQKQIDGRVHMSTWYRWLFIMLPPLTYNLQLYVKLFETGVSHKTSFITAVFRPVPSVCREQATTGT